MRIAREMTSRRLVAAALGLAVAIPAATTAIRRGGAGAPPPTIAPVAAPSGQSIILIPRDSAGNPAGVASVGLSDEVQAIRLLGTPAGDAFAVTFDGATTAPIPVASTPPAVYFTWDFPVVAGHVYDLAVTWPANDQAGPPGQEYGYETIDGGATLSSTTIGATPPAGQFADGVTPYGNAVYWDPVTPTGGVTPSGAALQVRFTGNHTQLVISGLRVRDRAAGTTASYDLTMTANYTYNASSAATGGWTQDANAGWFGGLQYRAQYGGTGLGAATAIIPVKDGAGNVTATGAQVLASALQSLASIPRGDVIVTDLSGLGSGNYQVQFVRGLGASSQPPLSCPDPAVSIARVNPGGGGITLARNGGAPALLGDRVYVETAPFPFVQLVLPQSAPAVRTFQAGLLPYTDSGDWDLAMPVPGSLAGMVTAGWSSGRTATVALVNQPPGTYQIAVTWPAGPLHRANDATNYNPSTATQFLVQDDLGDVLATYSVDQTRAPSSYADADGRGWHVLGSFATTKSRDGLTLVMTTVGQAAGAGGMQAVAILDGVQVTRTSPDQSVTLGPDDVATLSIPAGWISTPSGPLPAMAGLAVAPPSPTAIMPAFVAGPKAMKLGWNTHQAGYTDDMVTHSNLSYLMNPMGQTQDANCYPTRIRTGAGHAAGNDWFAIISPTGRSAGGQPLPIPPQGIYLINDGRFILTWTGDPTLSLVAGQGVTVTPVPGPKPTNVAGNWAVYDVRMDRTQTNRPNLFLSATGTTQDLAYDPSGNTYGISISGLQVYPPDPADPTGDTAWGLDAATNTWTRPPTFHPWYLDKLEGANNLRFLDPLNTNNNPAALISHYKTPAHATRGSPTVYNQTAAIAQVRAATAAERHYPGAGLGPFVVITTTAPHGLYDGCPVQFSGTGVAHWSNGTATTLDSTYDADSINLAGIVRVIDPTTLLCVLDYWPLGGMTNVTAGGSLVAPNVGTNWPLQDLCDLVAAVPTVTDLHFNAAITLDTTPGGQGAYAVARALAAGLPSGVKVHVEPGNECWNGQFATNTWCALEQSAITGQPFGTSAYATYYARQAKAIHDCFDAAFAAAGRPGDVVHLYDAFTTRPEFTAATCAESQRIGARIDEVCVAPYVNEGFAINAQGVASTSPYDADQLPIFHRMTAGQMLDWTELGAEYGGWDRAFITNQYETLQRYGYGGARVIGYEGNEASGVPVDPVNAPPPGNTPDYYLRRDAVRRHPRIGGIVLRHCQKFQDAGLTMWSFFYIGGFTNLATWNCYEFGNQRRGTGDPTLDLINVNSPQDVNHTLNEKGWAVSRWGSLRRDPSPVRPPRPVRRLRRAS